ncbi:programmed cell death 1 ligand 1 [Ctenopharyngodon idella]|uniref:programmed cell death 1 ligand 1 n=1 Tax=Ctenopharyngodon idella TaxID=7959 RepID=UPI00222EBFB2|nr:programmed cell death 1 ligand 1 [Ctenopharyngodon idella]XP_051733135.1 programmed cell death 1 ligand 1 [Ctenopharyngodon idella]XP_051733136.1 programmed cell death 1 ligand 1 [Ctenopharyngodon idella]
MRGMLVIIFQALLWPAVSALFTVNVQKSAYEAELHGDVELVCVFSTVKRPSDLTVIWSRVNPKPDVDVYRLEKGKENHNYTSALFIKRAHLILQQLTENRAVLHLKNLQIKDSGTYRCIVSEGDEGDYKQVTLNVTAPYTPIKKSIRKTGQNEVELSCESQGFPSPQVIWSDGQNANLTEKSNSSVHNTDEDLIKVISNLTVKRDLVNNYTCSFFTKGGIKQTATFSIPDELLHECSAQYMWIGAVVVVLLAIAFISFILRRRKNGQKNRRNESSKCAFLFPNLPSANSDSLLTVNENRPQTCDITSEELAEKSPSLRDVLTQQYSQLDTDAEVKRRLESYALHSKEGQSLNISSILPDKKQTILLLGEPGSGKTTVAQILSSCWARRITADAFNIHRLHMVVLVDCSRAEGDFFQVVKSNINYEKSIDVSDLRETLLGPTDCLLILDGYQEGNKVLDETLKGFLTERQTCRVLVTSHPGQCPALERTIRTVLQLIQRPEESRS